MLLTDEQVGIIHEAVWRECMVHKMEVNEAASVANRAVLRLRELGHYPKKTGLGATRECFVGCPGIHCDNPSCFL